MCVYVEGEDGKNKAGTRVCLSEGVRELLNTHFFTDSGWASLLAAAKLDAQRCAARSNSTEREHGLMNGRMRHEAASATA